jgi:hypothetical protein
MSDKAKNSEDKSKKDSKLVNTDMFTYQVNDNKGRSREEFDNFCQDAIGKIHGSWRALSKAVLHAFIHNIKFNDSTLIARIYGRVVNETDNNKAAEGIRAAAKECCAVSLSVDKSKTGSEDTVKIYKGTRDKDDWAKLWNGKDGPAECVAQMRKMETCLDDSITNSREFGLGLFVKRTRNQGGKSGTTTSKFHTTGKECGNLFVEWREIAEKVEKRHPECQIRLELLTQEFETFKTRVEKEVLDARKLVSGVAEQSGIINNSDESSQDSGESNNTDGDKDEAPEQDKAA